MGDRVIIGCGGATKTDGKINKQELSIFNSYNNSYIS
jgi:hypothetical protein